MSSADLVVLFEHDGWQAPLFAALDDRGIRYDAFDLKGGAYDPAELPDAPVVFNQASPSAYVRGRRRAVPLALSLLRSLEHAGRRVINGERAFALELSKSAQVALMRRLGIRHPRTIAFNDVAALERYIERESDTFRFPALVKPEQGGSGARIQSVESLDAVAALVENDPDLWEPDGLLLLQEQITSDAARGVVRLELVGGELLYAMRIVGGGFNLCPSEVCHPSAAKAAHARQTPSRRRASCRSRGRTNARSPRRARSHELASSISAASNTSKSAASRLSTISTPIRICARRSPKRSA